MHPMAYNCIVFRNGTNPHQHETKTTTNKSTNNNHKKNHKIHGKTHFQKNKTLDVEPRITNASPLHTSAISCDMAQMNNMLWLKSVRYMQSFTLMNVLSVSAVPCMFFSTLLTIFFSSFFHLLFHFGYLFRFYHLFLVRIINFFVSIRVSFFLFIKIVQVRFSFCVLLLFIQIFLSQ